MAEQLISESPTTTADPIALPTQSIDHSKEKQVDIDVDSNNNNNNDHGINTTKKTKKKSVNILKVALMLLLRRSPKPKAAAAAAAVDDASKSVWKRLFSIIRPLHLESNDQSLGQDQVVVVVDPPSLSSPPVETGLQASPSVESFEDVVSSPLSPNCVPKSSSIDDMSRYASAMNLHELDQNDKDENKSENENENDSITEENVNEGDEMIDAKAEMFIAQFYEQMKLQRSDSDTHNMERITTSIG